MARRMIAVLAVAGSLLAGGLASAQSGGGSGGSSGGTGSGAGGGAGSSTPVDEGMWHKVQSVDTDKGTVKTADGMDLNINKSTRVTRDGSAVSISDLQPGDEVRAAWLHGRNEGPVTELNVRSKEHQKSPVPTSK
jgi:hypothetical protein